MRSKKNVIIIILLLVAASVVLFAYGSEKKSDKTEVDLYFFGKGGHTLEVQKTEFSDSEKLYESVAYALIGGPQKKGLLPIMSKNVELALVKSSGGSMDIDFANGYPKDDLMATYAVIKTFSGLPGVARVRVTADGEDIVGYDGAAIGYVRGDEINVISDNDSATGIRLYFASSDKSSLVMEYRTVNITDTQPVEQYIITELIKGPSVKENERLLAADTEVLSVETTDGTCYVNFKHGFVDKNSVQGDEALLIIYSMVNSLTERDNVKNVQFLVEGKKTDVCGNADISELFTRNEDFIEKKQFTTE